MELGRYAIGEGMTLSLAARANPRRSEEHTSELQSLMSLSYALFCLKKKKNYITHQITKIYLNFNLTTNTIIKRNTTNSSNTLYTHHIRHSHTPVMTYICI